MTRTRIKSNAMTGPAVFAATGGVLLAAVLAPSPTRIELWDRVQVNPPEFRFPETEQTVLQTEIDTIVEKPLFNADRKKDPSPLLQGALPVLDTYRLAGVVAAGDFGIAIVERKQTKASITLRVGDSLDGRTVTGITPGSITFSGPAGSETLNIPKVYGASVAPQPESETGRGKTTTEGNGGKAD